jgi:hypothetical protein
MPIKIDIFDVSTSEWIGSVCWAKNLDPGDKIRVDGVDYKAVKTMEYNSFSHKLYLERVAD